jgi:hypothetical protein
MYLRLLLKPQHEKELDERKLSLFERNVLRHISGVKKENCVWRKKYAYEFYDTFQ